MTAKKARLFPILFLLVELLIGIFLIRSKPAAELDMVKINDLLHSCADALPQLKLGETRQMPVSEYPYSIFDSGGRLLYSQEGNERFTLHQAIKNRDTIIDLSEGDQTAGKLVISNAEIRQADSFRNTFLVFLAVNAGLFVLLWLSYTQYLKKTIFRPFRQLKDFAVRVANGNLDIPLSMDRNNVFGAFTESFDLMREELKRAQEQERKATQSKKELVAKLSHDIKTPIASIKAVAEVMEISVKEEKARQQLAIIGAKADQVDELISNLFHATLEELQELEVFASEHSSQTLYPLLLRADYLKKAEIGKIPECLVTFDPLRLQQVFDNLLGNSYKYANTSIQVTARLSASALIIRCRDYGPGVPSGELPLIFGKYYRGSLTEGKSGAGLGLYISHYLMEQMGGRLTCENLEDGFCVCVYLKI